MNTGPNQYVESLAIDEEARQRSQNSFLQAKSRQQLFLERLLKEDGYDFAEVGDICCGNGSLSYWLQKEYPRCHFHLFDLNPAMLKDAARICPGSEFKVSEGDIYDLKGVANGAFDLTLCWQTLSWLEHPQDALRELLRITKPGGRLYLSSLFNLHHDVDIYNKVYDWTRESAKTGHYVCYNVYSMRTVRQWLEAGTARAQVIPFEIDLDLPCNSRGLGTYTAALADGRRLQFSAGMLMNWGVLKIVR